MNTKRIIKLTFSWLVLAAYLALIVWAMYYAQVHPAPRYIGLDQGERFIANMLFWTTLSNLLAFFFLLVYLISQYKTSIKFTNSMFIIMSSIMTITLMLFWMALAGISANKSDTSSIPHLYQNAYNNPSVWIITTGLHLISPIIVFVAHFFFAKNNREYISYKTWHKKNIILATIFPWSYLAIVFVAGLIRMSILRDGYTVNGVYYDAGIISFPYFFFDLGTHYGYESFFGISAAILLLVYGANYFLIFLNNLRLEKKEEVVEVKEGKKQVVINILKLCFYIVYLIVFVLKILLWKPIRMYSGEGIFTVSYIAVITVGVTLLISQIIFLSLAFKKKVPMNYGAAIRICDLILMIMFFTFL